MAEIPRAVVQVRISERERWTIRLVWFVVGALAASWAWSVLQ